MADTLPRLLLIRHGNTEWSESHRFTGRTDLPLTPRGQENAMGLSARLTGWKFSRIFCSPLTRARLTCDLAGLGASAEIDPDLVEWDYGQIEGHYSAEVRAENPDWDLFRDGAPGGESPADVAARANRFIQKVRQISGDVAGFSSGHIIRTIAARWLGYPPTAAGNLQLSTASVSILTYDHDIQHPVIQLWNDDGVLVK
jgi:broad specificity phosphatase PhoE